MVSNLVAFFCDAGVPAVISTIITVCYLLIKFFTWCTDNFYAIPDLAKRSETTTASDKDSDSEATAQRNQDDTEGQSADHGHQTITTDHGLRLRQQQEEIDSTRDPKTSAHSERIQESTVLLPRKKAHDVLDTTEHYSQIEGVSTPTEHQRQLCKGRSTNSRSDRIRTNDHRDFDPTTIHRKGEAGTHATHEES